MKKIIAKIMTGIMACMLLTGIGSPAKANTMQTARNVTVGTPFSGVLTENEEVIYYRMNLEQAGTLSLAVTSYVESKLGIGIYDAQYQAVDDDTVYTESASGVGVETLTYELDKGTYYIKAIGNNGDSTNGYYYGNFHIQSSLKSAGVNHSESNNEFTMASPLNAGQKIKGHIAQNNVCDYYKIKLAKASRISLKVTSYMNEIGFRIYDGQFNSIDGNTVYWESASKVGVSTLSYDLDKGTYYIRVIGNYWDSTDSYYHGKYNFKYTVKATGVNHKENNNSFEQAAKISMKKTIKGQIALNNRVDYYKIKVNRGGAVKIKVSSRMYLLGYSIYNKSFENLKGNTKYWDSASQRVNWTGTHYLKKGTYYIRFIGNWSDSSDSSYFGNYSFRVYQ